MGGPSRLTPELRESIERELAEGVPVTVTAQRVGVAPRTLHSWLADGRVVRREQPDPLLVDATAPPATPDLDERLRAAVPGLVSVVLNAARRGSWQAAFRLLEAVDLAAKGRKRETIKKSVTYLRAVLDEQGLADNPARSTRVRLPREEPVELEPPTAEQVEAVYRLLASAYRLPLLWLDWSGARVASVETLRVGDYDEPGRHVRLRAATQKQRRALWVELPDVLAEAIEATLGPREDRDVEAPLFPGASADRLRTAIARASKAAGVPTFSPHDLRHRRISLLHRQGRSWAEIGRFVDQRKLSVTADTYTHVMADSREVNYAGLIAA